jgi:hypothetical protein
VGVPKAVVNKILAPKCAKSSVENQFVPSYSHIRSQAKPAAIQALEQPSIEPILEATGHKIEHSDASADADTQAKRLKTNGGPARI